MAIAFINIVLLVAVDLAGHTAKGAQRWLSLGPVSFQPSELAKLAIILLGAAYLGKVMEQGKKPSLVNHFSFAVVIIGLLVFKQPDMGTSAILIAIAFFLYILAGLPTLMVIGTILIGAVGAVVGVVIAPYRLNRIYVWLDPFRDPQGLGYQMVQSKVAIGSGGFGGLGPGQGLGKYFYLPEAHTDFAFSVFCQEHGFLGAFVLIVLFLMLGYVIYTVARRTRDHQGFLLSWAPISLSLDRPLPIWLWSAESCPSLGCRYLLLVMGERVLSRHSLLWGLFSLSIMTKCVGKKRKPRRLCPSAIHSGLPLWERRAIRKTGGKNEAFIFQFFPQKETKKGD